MYLDSLKRPPVNSFLEGSQCLYLSAFTLVAQSNYFEGRNSSITQEHFETRSQ